MLTATGYWTTTHVLVVLTAIVVAAALATMVAALGTMRSARRVARATEGQMEIATREAGASVRPVIVTIPGEAIQMGVSQFGSPSRRRVHIAFKIRNVGPGPAFVRDVQFGAGPGHVVAAQCDKMIMASGQEAQVSVLVPDTDPEFPAAASAASRIGRDTDFTIRYTDVFGGQRTATAFYVSPDTANVARIDKVQLYWCDVNWALDGQPHVSAGHLT